MKTASVSTTKTTTISRFVELVQAGISSWVEAGKLVAAEMEADPEFADKLVDAVPGLSMETVMRFNSIGRGLLMPELLSSSDCPGVRRLMKMPSATQQEYASKPLPVLVPSSDGWSTLGVDVRNLTYEQARQVFNGKAVRSEAAQRAWLEGESTRRKLAEIKVETPYVIRGKRLHCNEGCSFTARELAQILARMQE